MGGYCIVLLITRRRPILKQPSDGVTVREDYRYNTLVLWMWLMYQRGWRWASAVSMVGQCHVNVIGEGLNLLLKFEGEPPNTIITEFDSPSCNACCNNIILVF